MSKITKKLILAAMIILAASISHVTISAQGAICPSDQTMEVIQSESSLPSEVTGPELRAKPPGGDPIAGVDSPIGDFPLWALLLSTGAYIVSVQLRGKVQSIIK